MERGGGDTASRTLVVLPTYDEAATVTAVVRGVRALTPPPDVVVVDDASPDGTGRLADELAATDPAVRVLHRPRKAGLGSAYRDGLAWGLSRGYERFVTMDADGSHDPAELPALLAAADRADLVVGSRYVTGGRIERWSTWRRTLSRAGNGYARAVTGLPVRDATSGYRVVRRAALEVVDVASLRSEGYAFHIEVVWRAWRAGFAVVEAPIRFVERGAGRSKLSRRVVAEAAWRTLSWHRSRRPTPPARHPASVAGRRDGDPRASG